MNRERWELIGAIFARLKDLGEEERLREIEDLAAQDPELAAEVDRLLAVSPPENFGQNQAMGEVVRKLFAIGLEGKRLGDFELIEQIGRGGMGVVYRANQRPLDRVVAVKLLPQLQSDPSVKARFLREARAASALEHPNIASVIACGEEEGLSWYAMHYVDGHDLGKEISLQRALREGEPTESGEVPILALYEDPSYVSELVARIADLADAIQYAHGKGIVHRDIKPQNIVLDRRGVMHLVDFGIARAENLGQATTATRPRGTASYMSPEQARVLRAHVDHRTDVYSLAVVLYEALSLHRAFDGESYEEILTRVLENEPTPLQRIDPRVHPDLAVICGKGMRKRPNHRYASASALAEDLRRFGRHEAILARPPSRWMRIKKRWSRLPVWVRLVGAGVLLLLLGFWVLRGWQEHRRLQALPHVRLVWNEDERGSSAIEPVARAWTRRIDPVSGAPGPRVAFEDAFEEPSALEPGHYRILVQVDGRGSCELTRHIESDSGTLELPVRLVSAVDATLGMTAIPGGSFECEPDGPLGSDPVALRTSLDPYWIDEREVSNAEFALFLEQANYPAPHLWREKFGYGTPAFDELLAEAELEHPWGSLPAVGMSWRDAQAYAEWVGKRLPTHFELERALRGLELLEFPSNWGSQPPLSNVGHPAPPREPAPMNTMRERYKWALQRMVPTDDEAYRHGPSGLIHAYGNAAEWTESPAVEGLGQAPRENPQSRFYLGGHWHSSGSMKNHPHNGIGLAYSSESIGFRCARSASLP